MLYEIPQIEHVNARSTEEAIYWLSRYGDKAKVIAGGTDLLSLIKDKINGPQMPIPEVLINIKTIPEMDRIDYSPGKGLSIGATTTLYDIESSNEIREKFGMLADAAHEVATNQIRNMGTIGGNLVQRPWCWYFRVPQFNCYKKGGPQCYAISGSHKYYFSMLGLGVCVMAHPSDTAPALMALGAEIVVAGESGRRRVPIDGFFLGPQEVFETVLKPNEIITEVFIPEQPPNTRGSFLKSRLRGTWDFALSSVAARLQITNGSYDDAKIILGGVAPFPFRVPLAEDALRGKRVDEEVISLAAAVAVKRAHPLAQNGYKVPLTQNLVKRALMSASGLEAEV